MHLRMRHPLALALLLAVLVTSWTHVAHAARRTVCSITVNSPDERETFRRYLPDDAFEFVELVERGRPDWLASACHKGVRCDVLIVSGHFDGGTQFYSDRPGTRESLPVEEMERASCSAGCTGLFSQLKEVYLFGCNTLDPEPLHRASPEIDRALLRAGHAPADVERLGTLLEMRHGDSNREVMQHIFRTVPVIYGFSSKAPLGRRAAATLERYFAMAPAADIGGGRADARLLDLFAPVSMSVVAGITGGEPQASHRDDVCQLADDGRTIAHKIAFLHRLLDREPAEVRMLFDRMEHYLASLSPAERNLAENAAALEAIARDTAARERFLASARDAERAESRARMLAVARGLGWLTAGEERAELLQMFAERLASDRIGPAEVELACALNRDGLPDAELDRLDPSQARSSAAATAAVLACLGREEARARVLQALTSRREIDVELAQVYLSHRPIVDAGELRALTADIAAMEGPEPQVLALRALGRHRLSDRMVLEQLTALFAKAKSADVQRAVAGVLIRADYDMIATPALVRTLRGAHRPTVGADDIVDILIRRLELAIGTAPRGSARS